MSTQQVDFYALKTTQPQAELDFACRLVAKAYGLKHQIFIHTPSPEYSHSLDEQLWSFRANSFIPHQICQQGPLPQANIEISNQTPPAYHQDILMNLCSQAPDFYKNFKRVIEIVPAEETAKTLARERFRYYKEHGLNPQFHTI